MRLLDTNNICQPASLCAFNPLLRFTYLRQQFSLRKKIAPQVLSPYISLPGILAAIITPTNAVAIFERGQLHGLILY